MGYYDLTDVEWRAISTLFPPRTTPRGGRPFHDHRRTLDAILFVLVTGAPRRALPEAYGPWETAYARFARYRADGTFARLCGVLRDALRARGAVSAPAAPSARRRGAWTRRSCGRTGSAAGARRDGAAAKGGPSPRRPPESLAGTASGTPAAG